MRSRQAAWWWVAFGFGTVISPAVLAVPPPFAVDPASGPVDLRYRMTQGQQWRYRTDTSTRWDAMSAASSDTYEMSGDFGANVRLVVQGTDTDGNVFLAHELETPTLSLSVRGERVDVRSVLASLSGVAGQFKASPTGEILDVEVPALEDTGVEVPFLPLLLDLDWVVTRLAGRPVSVGDTWTDNPQDEVIDDDDLQPSGTVTFTYLGTSTVNGMSCAALEYASDTWIEGTQTVGGNLLPVVGRFVGTGHLYLETTSGALCHFEAEIGTILRFGANDSAVDMTGTMTTETSGQPIIDPALPPTP